MLIDGVLPTFISSGAKPTLENTSVDCREGTFTTKAPLLSVVVPVVVPFTDTLTPERGFPFSSFTVPTTLTSWEKAIVEQRIKINERKICLNCMHCREAGAV